MAVAWHAVRRGEVGKRTVAIVIGCGPVGLGVILMLKAKGVRTVVASDYSPGRRALAKRLRRGRRRRPRGTRPTPRSASAATSTTSRPRSSSPSARPRSSRAAGRLVARLAPGRDARRGPKHPVIFECVGVPGVIESIIDGAPLFSRVVVVGVCVGPTRSRRRWRSTRRSTCAS
jgi:threonine dehydrogenase-like Zn-dependent dehydrogenase